MLEFWGHYALAFALLSSGQIDAGVRATRQAESSMSNNLDEFSRILELYLRAGDIDAAEGMFQTSGGGWLDGHNNMAWFMATADLTLVDDASIRERMARQAVLHAEEALRTNPGFESVYNTLGIARLRAADYAGAREALQQSLAHQGGNGIPEDWIALAICEAELGNPEAARVWFERARPHVDGTIDRSLDGGLRLLVEQAARRLEVPSPLPPPR